MKRDSISVLAVAGAAAALMMWLVEVVVNGWSAAAICGTVATFAALAAGVALMLVRKRELDAIEKKYQEIREEMRREEEEIRQKIGEEIHRAEEESRQKMEQFRSTLVHSLRMPISIIQGYTDLLVNDMVDDPVTKKEYLEKISARTQYMLDVIRLQRLGNGGINKSTLVMESVDLLALVTQVVRDMQSAADEAEVRVQVLSSEEELVVMADAYLLNRVFYNLLENSMKYMRRSGVVTIRLARQEGTVIIQVQDDGVGMDSEETEHIFEKNYQGSNRVGGQGYGLYIVKESIEAHGGSITARSAPGQGMGIMIRIPDQGQESA